MPMDIKDVQTSVSRFMGRRAAELGYTDIQVLPGFSDLPQTRPIWVLQSNPGGLAELRLRHQTMMNYRFHMNMLTAGGVQGYLQAEAWIARCQQKLMQNNWYIPGLIHDFVYPSPGLRYLAGQGSLAAGTYFVVVTGINHIDEAEETLPSGLQSIVVPANAGRIEVLVPRYPMGYNWFKKFNVYMGTSSNDLKKTADSPVNDAPVGHKVYHLDDVSSGANPPSGARTIKFRLIEIMQETFNTSVVPDVSREAGTWIGSISCAVRAPLTTISATPNLGYTITEVNQEIDIEE